MSRVFHRADTEWESHPLAPGRVLGLAVGGGDPSRGPGFVEPGDYAAPGVVRVAGEAAAAVDALLVAPGGPGPLVSGTPVAAGLRVLADRDTISWGAGWLFYVAVDPAVIEDFPRDRFSEPVFCPRCNSELEGGLCVRCQCGTWYHEDGELNCYSHGPCVCCRSQPSLGGMEWTPEEV